MRTAHLPCRSFRLLRFATSLLFALTFLAAVRAAETGGGSVAITVTSAKTRNALQGAAVSIPALRRDDVTDEAGTLLLKNLPAGPLELRISYTGFQDERRNVVVRAGETTQLNADLRPSEIVTMEKFTVETVKEGQALSVTEQRNAANIKNVTALDEWGVLPTQNIGELFTRLPGVSFTTDEDDLINNITLRGMVSSNGQSFTRLVVDGMSSTGVGGNGRTATMHSFSAAMYEQLELISGQTPDKRADSIGGQINLKTRSPLAMREKRRFDYNLSGRYSPDTSKRNADFAQRPYGYVGTLGYTEVFSVGGGDRNLGVALNVAQQQITTQFDFDLMQYPSVVDGSAAFFRDYDKRSGTNERFITGLGARADYRLFNNTTTISARFIYNAGSEPFFHYTFVNPFFSTNTSVYDPVTNPAGGFVAGSNSTRSEIRPVGNSQMLLTPRRWSFTSTNPTSSLFFEHNLGRLKIDHAWRFSHTHWDANSGRSREGGMLTLRTKNPIGFILDNSNVDGRVFTQTAASAATDSVYNPASYQTFLVTAKNATSAPVDQTSNRLDQRSFITNTDEWSGTINASYLLPTELPITLKGGLDTVNRRINGFQRDPRRWYAVNGSILSGYALMPLTTFEQNQGGQRLPVFDPYAVVPALGDATRWYEDVNFNVVQKLTSSRHMKEAVDAGYFQAQLRVKRLSVLGGVRAEHVKENTWTYFRARTNAIAVEPDPYKRALLDFDRQATHGVYTKYFPSVHASYDITANLKARASWSTSYARPDLLQLVPATSVNDTAQTVTIGNPDLRPQLARDIDVKLEYYFKNSGILSVAAYEKRISDYLPGVGVVYNSGETVPHTIDNGFDGLYGGYQIIRPRNIGSVRARGLEFEYKQALTFLPGVLRGLYVRANWTILTAKGQFVFTPTQPGFIERKTHDIPGMQPQSGNFGLSYTSGRFGATFDVNYTSGYATTTVANLAIGTPSYAQLNAYRKPLTRTNAGVTYRVHPSATLYLDVNNIGETGPDYYTFVPSRPRQHYVVPMSIVGGISGRF